MAVQAEPNKKGIISLAVIIVLMILVTALSNPIYQALSKKALIISQKETAVIIPPLLQLLIFHYIRTQSRLSLFHNLLKACRYFFDRTYKQ